MMKKEDVLQSMKSYTNYGRTPDMRDDGDPLGPSKRESRHLVELDLFGDKMGIDGLVRRFLF